MIILNEIMDTMSQEKRAMILNRIANRQEGRDELNNLTQGMVKQPNHYASEVNKRALKSNIKKYGIKTSDFLLLDRSKNRDIYDTRHIFSQYGRLLDRKKKKLKAQQNKSNQDNSPNNTSIPKTESPKDTSKPPKIESPKDTSIQPKIETPKDTSKPITINGRKVQKRSFGVGKVKKQVPNTTNGSWFGRNKGKVALGIGATAAAAYGIHKYRQNKKKEEEARRQAEAQKKTGLKRFLK